MGAFVFGYLTDRFGRKNLFTITLGIYLLFTVASGLAWNYWSFVSFRLLAGAGIGGEYSAINSAIDELLPARVRGRVALAINGSWWVGTAGAAVFSYVLLHGLRESIGWRLGFFVGATLALGIIIIRRFIPESPRWLLTHGRAAEAEQVVDDIEDAVRKQHPVLPEPKGAPIVVEQRRRLGFFSVAKYVVQNYPQRGLLGLALMTGQAFLYNAIFFTYTLVLTKFFGVDAKTAPLYLIPFAVGNFFGPLLLGRLFDTLGRRVMIPFTYITSGLLLLLSHCRTDNEKSSMHLSMPGFGPKRRWCSQSAPATVRQREPALEPPWPSSRCPKTRLRSRRGARPARPGSNIPAGSFADRPYRTIERPR